MGEDWYERRDEGSARDEADDQMRRVLEKARAALRLVDMGE